MILILYTGTQLATRACPSRPLHNVVYLFSHLLPPTRTFQQVAEQMNASLYDRHTTSAPGLAYYAPPPSASTTSNSLPEQSSTSRRVPPGGSTSSRGEPGPSSRRIYAPISLETDTNWEPHVERTPLNCSQSTLENARYSLERDPRPDHPNEDRYFALEKATFKVFAVFDGHDGGRAAGFASSYMRELFKSISWERAVSNGGEIIAKALEQFFVATDREFFRSLQPTISEVKALKSAIPPGLKSFEAFQRYPYEVSRLQELEPKLAGGCTSAIAVLANNFLYVANVGDSRVLVIKERPNGTLEAHQLTKDHSVENEAELQRLEALGLRRENLLRAGRLGTQENTRSIGDYNIKEGYRDMDSLSSAREPPGSCSPHIVGQAIDPSFRYLVVMSDGVYKSIENTFLHQSSIESNKVLTHMINHTLDTLGQDNIDSLTDNVLLRLMMNHEDCYYKNARSDPRSPLATACRKRDDMTLIVYKFPAPRRRSSFSDLTSP